MALLSHQYFSLRWNNYQSTMTSVFQQLREDQSFVDVTLSCESGSLKAHKVVLSACSSYFQKLLLDNPCKHPTIILPSEILFNDLKTIIDFVYRGEIDVTEAELQGLLRTAEHLKIKGLCETAEADDNIFGSEHTIHPANNLSNSAISINNSALSHHYHTLQNNTIAQRKTRLRKCSKSSSDNNCNIASIHLSGNNITSHQTFNTGTIVSINSNQSINGGGSSGGSINSSTVTGEGITGNNIGETTTPSAISTSAILTHFKTEQDHLTNNVSDSISSDNSVILTSKSAKVCKIEDSSNNGGNVVAPGTAIVTQIVVSRENKDKSMTSLGMGVNGTLLGVPMGFLDFTPEPPAPSATPVTEHVDMTCTPSTDTRDLSNPTETLDIDNHIAHHIIQRLDQDQSPIHHHIQHHTTSVDGNKPNLNLIQNIKNEITGEKPNQHHLQHHHQQQLHSQQIQEQSHSQHHEDLSGTTVMEIDTSNIKHEPGMIITPEIVTMMTTGHMDIYNSDTSEDSLMIANGSPNDSGEPHYTNLDQPNDDKSQLNGPKTWTQQDMVSALDALKNHRMSLTKASVTYGIPSTTLWQRAHRMGIDTPKKEGTTKSWNEESLNNALDALRTGQISANKASKAYGIPSSTLYKIARREGIRLAAPFNAAPTTWSPEDLERALEAIRAGHTSVQKASTEFGIPTGTLYGRCKREGIELSRSNPTPWSEDAMNEALVAVRVGHMSINQAAIHYNLPYSSLYGRFKRGKYDTNTSGNISLSNANNASIEIIDQTSESSIQFQYSSPSPSNTPQQQTHHQQIHIQQHHHHHSHLQHQSPQQQDITSSNQRHNQATSQIQPIYHHSTPERS